MPEKAPEKKQREIPLPVKLAREALDILQAEGVTGDDLAKLLPAFAMNLAKTGGEVTLDILLEHARTGELNLKVVPEQRQKTYEEIVAGFYPEGEAPVRKTYSSTCDIFEAAEMGLQERVKSHVAAGIDVNAENRYGNTALIKAVSYHRGYTKSAYLEITKLLIDHGADVTADNNKAFRCAEIGGDIRIIKLLIDHGADKSILSEERKKQLQDFINCSVPWQKTIHLNPPLGLEKENPLYFHPKAFEAVSALLQKEGHCSRQANKMAFHAAGLFGTEERVLQYLEKWGTAGKQPVHDLIYKIKLSAEKTPEMDLTAWADAVLKCGPSMAKLVKFADRLPVPEKSDDGRTWSMVKTREKVAQFAYPRAKENPALAAVGIEHGVEENDFNKALELIPAKTKNIPDISIDGKEFDAEGAKFYRLPADDVRGLFLGEMTDCCQSIGGNGTECAEHGFTSENGGFYVVENAKGRVVAQTWAWRGTKGELVFDSIETLGQNVTDGQWKKLTSAFADALAKNPGDVTQFNIGTGGKTPDSLASVFNKVAKPADPLGYKGYRDSRSQVTVWKKPS